MKKLIVLLIALMTALSNATSSASEKIIEASGEYVMDSRLDETPASATSRAREEAKRAAVEKAGVYLQSYSKMIDLEINTDEVQTVAARLLKIQDESSNVEVIEKNLLKFTVTIKALVDDLDDDALKKMMQDKQTLEELTRKNKDLQEKYDALNREMAKYRSKFDSAGDAQKIEIKKEVVRNTEKFSALNEFAKGNDFSFRKDYAQALASYDMAIKLDPQLAEAYNNRGIVKYDLGQFSTAVEDYTTAIKLKTGFINALNNRGNAYVALGQFQNAVKDIEAVLKLNDNFAAGHNNLGGIYYSMKNYDAAIKEYTRAIQIDPHYAEAYYNRGAIYFGLGKYVEALSDIKMSMSLNPNDNEISNLYNKIIRNFE